MSRIARRVHTVVELFRTRGVRLGLACTISLVVRHRQVRKIRSGERPQVAIDWRRVRRSDIEAAVQDARREGYRNVFVLTDGDIVPTDITGSTAVVYACENVDRSLPAVRGLIKRGVPLFPVGQTGPARFIEESADAKVAMLEALRVQETEGWSKFDCPDFQNLLQLAHATRNVPGAYVEVGCFRGSSADVVLRYLDRAGIKRRAIFVDVFDGFNYPEALESADRMWAGTHVVAEGRAAIAARLGRLETATVSVEVRQGNICERRALDDVEEIAMANIDVDLYEAVRDALDYIWPKLSVGGIIVAEDAGHTPMLIGARVAVEEFLARFPGAVHIIMESGQHCVIKVRSG